jgi:hypothetical protein
MTALTTEQQAVVDAARSIWDRKAPPKPVDKVGDIWFRAEEQWIDDGSEMYAGVTIAYVEWEVTKVTSCGVWLRCVTWPYRSKKKERFALKSGARAFRRTKLDALQGLIARKNRQLAIVAHQKQVAEDTLEAAARELESMKGAQ